MPPEKLGRAHEDQIKPRTSELFDSETLEQFNLDIIALSISLPGVNVVNMDFSQHRFELDLKVNIVICLHKSAQMLPRQNQEMTMVSWHSVFIDS